MVWRYDQGDYDPAAYPYVTGELWQDAQGQQFWIARATQPSTAYVDGARVQLVPGQAYLPSENSQTNFFSFNETFYKNAGAHLIVPGSTVHVSDYGAVGDGVADDTNAFTAAIAAATSSGSGATVELDQGRVYKISLISLSTGTSLNGRGATIKPTTTIDRPITIAGSTVKITDLIVDVGSTPTAATVYAGAVDKVILTRVTVTTTGLTGAGIRLNNCTNSRLEECTVNGFGNAINNVGGHDNKIKYCKITGTVAGVLVNPFGAAGAVDIDVIGVTVRDFPTGVVLGYPIRSAGTSPAHNTRIRFLGCTVIGPNLSYYNDGTTPGGTADQINMVYTDGGTIEQCHSLYGGDMGFSCSNCRYMTIVGNLSMFNDAGGITVSTATTFAAVTGNTCLNNGQNHNGETATNGLFGIGTGGSSYVAIMGNTIGDDQAAHTQQYGVRCMFGGDTIDVGPNTNHGNATANFYTDGSVTNITQH